MNPNTGLGPWGNTVTLAVIVWLLIGVFTLTMPIAFLMWIFIGLVAASLVYFGGVRFWKWGVGK